MSQYVSLVTRNGLTWLLIAQALTIFPLSFYLPWWILTLWLGCALWRIQIYRMKVDYPGTLVKIIIVLVIAMGIYFSRGTIVGLDGGVALLIAAFSLKLLELKSKRDALFILYIGFLVIVPSFLYNNSFNWVVYSLLPIITLLSSLIGLNQTKLTNNIFPVIKLACILLIQAIPLMFLLFFFFPRLEPLWALPIPKEQQQKIGISNKMIPGEISKLTRSSELVFRANFTNKIPSRNKLYWRALTLEVYNGRAWSQAWDLSYIKQKAPSWRYNPLIDSGINYHIVLQPSFQSWLVYLETPQLLPADVKRYADFHLERSKPINNTYSYQLTSWLNALRESDNLERININTQLPLNTDPRARAFALQLRKTYQDNPEQIVNALLKHFHDQAYYYTLQTPDMGPNSVDTFFFDIKRGFCEHYASATAFILRSANIPARVVLGYQGGEVNSAGNFVQVHQFDAHAWVEYWQRGKGWITIDPTFQVAPSRIEQGLSAALNPEDQQQLSNTILGYGSDSLLTKLRLGWANFNNEWDIFVGTFDSEQQRGLLQKILGTTKLTYLGIFLVLGFVLISIFWLLILFKPWTKNTDSLLEYYHQFEMIIASQGLVRELGEGPVSFAKRAGKSLPASSKLIEKFINAFVAERYAEQKNSSSIPKILKKLRQKFPWHKRLFENLKKYY